MSQQATGTAVASDPLHTGGGRADDREESGTSDGEAGVLMAAGP